MPGVGGYPAAQNGPAISRCTGFRARGWTGLVAASAGSLRSRCRGGLLPERATGQRRAEYFGYSSGRTIDRPDLGGDRRELLAQVLGQPVDEEQSEQWAARSEAEEPPAAPEAAQARTLRRLGEFELLSELGRGGMGVVYRAWQPSLGRQVALKSLLRAGDAKSEARFNREIHALHRDIKPDNVLVTPDGSQAVLMDLGLAQLADETEGRLTRTRQFVGTLRYASPEQVLSVPLDRRSDVYSLGATLWELLTLQPIFGATEQTPTPELMLKVQSSDPERPRRLNPRVPVDLDAIVFKCLEKDRNRRYGSAQELADDLARWLGGEPVQAQPPTLGYLLRKSLRRHRVAVRAGLCRACWRLRWAALPPFRFESRTVWIGCVWRQSMSVTAPIRPARARPRRGPMPRG